MSLNVNVQLAKILTLCYLKDNFVKLIYFALAHLAKTVEIVPKAVQSVILLEHTFVLALMDSLEPNVSMKFLVTQSHVKTTEFVRIQQISLIILVSAYKDGLVKTAGLQHYALQLSTWNLKINSEPG